MSTASLLLLLDCRSGRRTGLYLRGLFPRLLLIATPALTIGILLAIVLILLGGSSRGTNVDQIDFHVDLVLDQSLRFLNLVWFTLCGESFLVRLVSGRLAIHFGVGARLLVDLLDGVSTAADDNLQKD